ncbi:unnamed protein product [Hydatigera taeniaeformis]|uniref:Prothymosin alpha-like n=1 Tax=Hydatigena taeniaeformis TaxID=6205 RepID=A0A0R3WPM4_HYDTA|nr:unnamed protein product [Hydatigera taeniaeformis]
MAEVEAKAPEAVTEIDSAPGTSTCEEQPQNKLADEEVKGEKPKEGKSEPMANGKEEKGETGEDTKEGAEGTSCHKKGEESAEASVEAEDHKEVAEGQSQSHHEAEDGN